MLLGCVLVPVLAWGAESETGDLFRKGTVEVGGFVGGGFSVRRTGETTLFALFPRVGYVVREQAHVLPGSLEVGLEPGCFTVWQGKTAHVFSLSAFIKYNFFTGTALTPFVEMGAGISEATRAVPDQGSHFNFLLQPGLGLQYAVAGRNTINLEGRFTHFSNADIFPPNPSLNSVVLLLGFSHHF